MNLNIDGNQIMDAPNKVRITAKDFAAKYKSKREVYNFLSVDCAIYLPAYGKKALSSLLMFSFLVYRVN